MQTNLRNFDGMSIQAAEKLRYNQPVGRIVQLVRTPLLHRGGRRFESCSAHTETPEMGIFDLMVGGQAYKVSSSLQVTDYFYVCDIRTSKITNRNEYVMDW